MRWWVHELRILGSSNPSDSDLQQLARDGFTVLVSLLKEDEQPPDYAIATVSALGYRRHTIEISDGATPTVDQIYQFIDWIASYPKGEKVLLHCEGGCGRTGTFAAAWWIANGLSAPKATTKVRQANPYAIETPGQEKVLEMFARDVDEIHRQALDTFGRLVALLYREIGVMNERNHSEIAGRRNLSSGFFATPQRKVMARELYSATSGTRDPDEVLDAFMRRTGLSLRDVHRVFSDGQWKNSSGGYSYGGPKWARVAECALSFYDELKLHDIAQLKRLLKDVGSLEHNNGKVVDKFAELDRR